MSRSRFSVLLLAAMVAAGTPLLVPAPTLDRPDRPRRVPTADAVRRCEPPPEDRVPRWQRGTGQPAPTGRPAGQPVDRPARLESLWRAEWERRPDWHLRPVPLQSRPKESPLR